MKEIETIIPAYRPAPCDCCTQDVGADLKTYYYPHCDCGNVDDAISAAMWCAEMRIADRYDEYLEKEGKQHLEDK